MKVGTFIIVISMKLTLAWHRYLLLSTVLTLAIIFNYSCHYSNYLNLLWPSVILKERLAEISILK